MGFNGQLAVLQNIVCAVAQNHYHGYRFLSVRVYFYFFVFTLEAIHFYLNKLYFCSTCLLFDNDYNKA